MFAINPFRIKALLTFCVFILAIQKTNADVYIQVGQALVKKSLVALPPFQYHGSPASAKSQLYLGTQLYNTVKNDLDVSAYFKFIRQSAYLEDTRTTALVPYPRDPKGFKFNKWTPLGTDFLIRGAYKVINNKLTFQAYVYHIKKAKLIMGQSYQGTPSQVRKIAHTFCNDLIKTLTGKPGMFLSKIVVSRDTGGKGWKEIWAMDWDGHNAEKITKHRSVTLSPSWSPDGKEILYTYYAYHKKKKIRNADLFAHNLLTGKKRVVSTRKGTNSGAVYHPTGNTIYVSQPQKSGAHDIVQLTKSGNYIRHITKGPLNSMNVEPSVSPDGTKIAFSSDRSGKPMIYIMNADGTNPKRRTFAGRYNASPSWSPDGKKIAFAGYDKGHFDIFIMNADGTQLERLTTAKKANGRFADNESPTFSPDGRHVIFTSDRTGREQLFIINIDGSNERQITVDNNNYFKPKWGWHTP